MIKPKFINTGYLKLDYMYKKIKIKKLRKIKKNKTILIAPGYSLNYKKYSMYTKLKKIIFNLINVNKYRVIFRPHPLDLTNKGQKKFVYEIINQFKKYKNFKEDLSVSYSSSCLKSKILITDISSIAYTYAFANEKTVIFFSKNESLLKKDKFLKINYIKDRNKIGVICINSNKITTAIKKIEKNYNIYVSRIKSLRKKRIHYFNQSITRTENEINNILHEI
jgi:CDP-glycerol glycerophosphotransferase (TagB/SpsB family)